MHDLKTPDPGPAKLLDCTLCDAKGVQLIVLTSLASQSAVPVHACRHIDCPTPCDHYTRATVVLPACSTTGCFSSIATLQQVTCFCFAATATIYW